MKWLWVAYNTVELEIKTFYKLIKYDKNKSTREEKKDVTNTTNVQAPYY